MGFEHLPFGTGGLVVIGAYVVVLLGLGFVGRRFTKEKTLGDFYLAGRGLGLVVLFLTLYATQYSGNTLLAFSGKGYRIGFGWLMSVQFMMAIVVVYLALAPRLSRLSRRHDLVTPADYVLMRFRTPLLAVTVSLIMIFVAGNFAVAQLKAMGKFFVALSGGKIDLWVGVVVLALVMVIYESIGGMRAVAWTDALQGVTILACFVALLIVLTVEFGPLSSVTRRLMETKPVCVQRPPGDTLREWFSFVVLFGFGASCYPMAIQRLYASRDRRSLQRSIALMAFMPLFTTGIALVVGLYGAAHLTGTVTDADQVLPMLCVEIIERSPVGYYLSLILLAAFLAALMSTADSALLSLASMFTRDVYEPYVRPGADQAHLTRVSKFVSWSVMGVLVALALVPLGGLIRLLEIKMEMLVQVAPAFLFGLHSRFAGRSILIGLLAGVALGLGLTFATDDAKIAGIHAGTVGLVINVTAVLLVEWLRRTGRRRAAMASA